MSCHGLSQDVALVCAEAWVCAAGESMKIGAGTQHPSLPVHVVRVSPWERGWLPTSAAGFSCTGASTGVIGGDRRVAPSVGDLRTWLAATSNGELLSEPGEMGSPSSLGFEGEAGVELVSLDSNASGSPIGVWSSERSALGQEAESAASRAESVRQRARGSPML